MNRILADGIKDWQFGFQEPSTPIQEGIISFHNDIMLVMIFMVCFVTVMLIRIIMNFRRDVNKEVDNRVHGTVIEIVWTCIPAIVLMIVAVPSFTLLYAVEEVVEPSVTVKVVGHQWYWSYEYSDFEDGEGLEFDSYMIAEEDLVFGELRLLEVDNRLILPIESHIRLIVTSADVLHSFAVPSFGLKIDACPGRLNEVSTFIKRAGVYYGQCSELCGVNHAFMPICVEGMTLDRYVVWLEKQIEL